MSMTFKDLQQQWDEKFREKCTDVEFLHGVPVDLPEYYKKELQSFLSEMATAFYEAGQKQSGNRGKIGQ